MEKIELEMKSGSLGVTPAEEKMLIRGLLEIEVRVKQEIRDLVRINEKTLGELMDVQRNFTRSLDIMNRLSRFWRQNLIEKIFLGFQQNVMMQDAGAKLDQFSRRLEILSNDQDALAERVEGYQPLFRNFETNRPKPNFVHNRRAVTTESVQRQKLALADENLPALEWSDREDFDYDIPTESEADNEESSRQGDENEGDENENNSKFEGSSAMT